MKIVIAGSGAMGATYGCMLKKSGNDVTLLDLWQENIDTINNNGVKFNNLGTDENIKISAYKPNEFNEIPDLLIVFTKSMQLKNMLSNVSHLIGENTAVLCLLNGLGHIDTLKEFVKEDNILMGVTVLTAGMNGAGNFKVTNYGKTEIQNIGINGKEKAMNVVNALNEAKLPTVYSEDIKFSIWRKACINGTMNACCALLDCNMLQLGEIPKSKELLNSIVKEFSEIAKKEGTILNVDEMTDLVCWFTTKEFAGVHHYPSMHQDLIQNKRKTEIDFLNGYISRKGKEYNISTPVCDLITLFIHGRENILEVK